MKQPQLLIPLFQKFITDTKTGRRLKKNGARIKDSSIQNYKYVLKNLSNFGEHTNFELRVCDVSKMSKREYTSEKNYWKKFYKKYTTYLYNNGCHDNYVGQNIKVIRTFFNYLKHDRDLNIGDFHHMFYVRREEIEVLVLTPNQLKFLIHNQEFHDSLSKMEQSIKDVFVFGCSTGLRFSDIYQLTNKNFEKQDGIWYLKIKSQKTKTYSFIKLPLYVIKIIQMKSSTNKKTLFKPITLVNFNKNVKKIGEKAGFTQEINPSREQLGRIISASKKNAILLYDFVIR